MHDARDLGKITQGVTCEIMGEAWSPAPFGGRIQSVFPSLSQKQGDMLGDWIERVKGWKRFGDWERKGMAVDF